MKTFAAAIFLAAAFAMALVPSAEAKLSSVRGKVPSPSNKQSEDRELGCSGKGCGKSPKSPKEAKTEKLFKEKEAKADKEPKEPKADKVFKTKSAKAPKFPSKGRF
jgi:hypothetical protein